MRIAYLVPSRGRPANAARLAQRWRGTAASDTHLIFLIDDDDPELPSYEKALDKYGDEQIFYMIDERRRVGPTLNHWAPKFAARYDAIGFMGDDHLPQTARWDTILGEYLVSRRHGIVYGNDLFQGPNLPTAVLMDATIVRTLGFIVPRGLTHLYLDNFWRDLGMALGTLLYVPQVVIEHLHPQAQKAEWDDGYREVNGGAMWEVDAAVHQAFMSDDDGFVSAVRALQQVKA